MEIAGVQSDALLDQNQISPQELENRESSVALADYVRFFESAAVVSGNPFFGLHAARLMSADGLGPLSFLFLSAPTLGQAFETFTEYLDTMQEATFNSFETTDDVCFFSYAIRNSEIVPRRQDAEYSIGVMCNLVRQYLGQNVAPLEIHFEHSRQGILGSYESYFGCQVFFEQPHNRIYLSTDLLSQSSSALSPELFPIIADHLRHRIHGYTQLTSTANRVGEMLMSEAPDALPSLDQMASRFGISRATLIRRLSREGVRFSALTDERKLGFAKQLMLGSDRPISDIALAAGYSETASFTRAFSRRVGTKPSLWRRQQKRPPAA